MYWIIGALYCAALWLVFDKLRLVKLSLPIAIVVGATGPLAILSLLFGAQYFHPYSTNARVFQQVIPVIPQLSEQGRVIEIRARPNARFTEGDSLILVDPVPYELNVARLEAALEEAKHGQVVAKANVEVADAALASATANLEFATKDRDRNARLVEEGAASQEAYEASINRFSEASAAVKQAKATLVQAQLSVESAELQIVQTESELANARYDLEQTDVRAPGDGVVTNLQVQVGTPVGGSAARPVMSFVLDADEATRGVLVASFGQKNYLKMKPGQYAEVAFNAYPGEILKGRVLSTIDFTTAGQLTERGIAPDLLRNIEPTEFAVRIRLDRSSALRIPAGSQGHVAVYTEEMQIAGLPVMFVIREQSCLSNMF